jgi:hypothetical protein
MTRRYWGTYYLVRPDWEGDPEHSDQSVVEAYRNGPSHMQVAIELWRLVHDERRASDIEAVLEAAFDAERPILGESQISQLLANLEGLDSALEKSVVGPDWRVPEERLPELRARTKLVDLDPDRGATATAGVAEAMSRVSGLREFLRSALTQKLNVALD